MHRISQTDLKWEKKLNIATAAANFEKDDANHSRYEPTSYAVLERLAESGLIGKNNTLLDYGCGKGRVSFFMHYAAGCRSIGLDFNPDLIHDACANLKSYAARRFGGDISFICESAENHIPDEADCFYFFNPFSAKILHSVIGRIIRSCYDNPRPARLFFYYALDPYIDLLMSEDDLEFESSIDCRDLCHNDDPREKILVYRINCI